MTTATTSKWDRVSSIPVPQDRLSFVHPIVVRSITEQLRRVLACSSVPRCATQLHLGAHERHRTASLGELQAGEAPGVRERRTKDRRQ